ncbi:MAG: response regulator [bacterium]|nr:response regulator [bacterium]
MAEMPDTPKENILIVDDTPANLRLLSSLLSESGFKARGVPNGPLALKAADLDPPNLIMLDITMPDMDGYEVCRRLKEKENTRDIPIIFISALDRVEDKVNAFKVGGVDYITKPFQVEEVLARVQNHLTLQRLRKELQDTNNNLERIVEERTQEIIKQVELFKRFVPPNLTKNMDRDDFNVSHGISQEEIYSVFSCDIRNFTTFSESVTCTECFRFINSFFTVMGPGIREFGGFVYQYIGDAIMALFKLEDDQYTDNVVRSAIAIQKQILVDYNQGRERAGYRPIRVGIGINTGPVATGVTGTPDRMDAAVFGNTVNLAARCESMTKEVDASIIMTELTFEKLKNPDAFQIRSLGKQSIRGMENQVHLYAVDCESE